ncbi:MAG: MerR family transcriptional regulator [Saprospiraceae bacterium]|nr:MerR family transcriptional regulator [Saprospiraceae bacterium]
MAVYSIRDLEELSGVKAHTIRIWEKRYGIIQPQRTETNIRFYQDDDLKTLLNIALLNKNGIKISKIAKMSDEDISEQVAQITDIELPGEDQVDALSLSLIQLDEFKFHSILNSNIRQIGFEQTMLTVIYPFLEKLSLLWLSGAINQVHERFLILLLKQKIFGATDQLHTSMSGRSFLIFLPEQNVQELSFLFLHYMLKKRNFKVVNLGIECPIEDVISAFQNVPVDFVMTLNTDDQHDTFEESMNLLLRHINKPLIISGSAQSIVSLESNENVTILSDIVTTLKYLDKIY